MLESVFRNRGDKDIAGAYLSMLESASNEITYTEKNFSVNILVKFGQDDEMPSTEGIKERVASFVKDVILGGREGISTQIEVNSWSNDTATMAPTPVNSDVVVNPESTVMVSMRESAEGENVKKNFNLSQEAIELVALLVHSKENKQDFNRSGIGSVVGKRKDVNIDVSDKNLDKILYELKDANLITIIDSGKVPHYIVNRFRIENLIRKGELVIPELSRKDKHTRYFRVDEKLKKARKEIAEYIETHLGGIKKVKKVLGIDSSSHPDYSKIYNVFIGKYDFSMDQIDKLINEYGNAWLNDILNPKAREQWIKDGRRGEDDTIIPA